MSTVDELNEIARLNEDLEKAYADFEAQVKELNEYLNGRALVENKGWREQAEKLAECVKYFVDRCEGFHPDGQIRSRKTYGMFKGALTEFSAWKEKMK